MKNRIKKDGIKKDGIKKDGIKKDETKKDETKKDETKKDEAKKDETKKDETKKDETKKDETKKDETKKDETKKDETKKDETKKDEIKKDETKKLVKWGKENIQKLISAVAVILLIPIIILSTKVLNKKDTGNTDVMESETTSLTEMSEEILQAGLLELMRDYYGAYAQGDTQALSKIAIPISELEKSYIKQLSGLIEEYQNFEVTSVARPSGNSRFVSVTYDLKFKDADVAAPGMEFFYVEKNADAGWVIDNTYGTFNMNAEEQKPDPVLLAEIKEYERRSDVTALKEKTEAAYQEAVKKDEKLSNVLKEKIPEAIRAWRQSTAQTLADATTEQPTQSSTEETSATEQPTQSSTEETSATEQPTQPPAEETSATEQPAQPPAEEPPATEQPAQPPAEEPSQPPQQSSKVRVKENGVNIRKTPGLDGEYVASGNAGEIYEKHGVEGEWVKISGNGITGYIRSDFLEDVQE